MADVLMVTVWHWLPSLKVLNTSTVPFEETFSGGLLCLGGILEGLLL